MDKMDELLANLNSDTPIFDAPSVLGPSFDMDNGFVSDQPDQVPLYSPDLGLRAAPQPPQDSADDFLEVDEPDTKPVRPSPSPPPPLQSPTIPKTEAAQMPDSPADTARRALRPLALQVLSDSWSASRNPAEFLATIRQRMPTATPGEENSDMPPTKLSESDALAWHLPEPTEGALLDALFMKLINGDATSTRLMSYLSHCVVATAVSQRAALSTALKWITTTPTISQRVMQSISYMLAQLIPHYRFTRAPDLTPEVKDFLAAFVTVLKCSSKSPTIARQLVAILQDDRVIALLRACARRMPSIWQQINVGIAELESPSEGSTNPYDTFASQSAITVAPELNELIPRLRKGLCVGITTLESIAYSIGNLAVPTADASQPIALQTAFAVTLQVFGTDVATALRDLWSKRERPRGDLPLLVALEKATTAPGNANPSHSQTQKYGFKNKVQACEAMVRFLAERSSEPNASEKWKGLWGGKERLKRIIRDAIPQVKNEIQSETGALIVSMAVTCCAAMCLGPALRTSDANDGVDVLDPVEASKQEAQNEEVEETMGELISFAVGSLEEAACAEETPKWRSFGLWLLLLMSRSGSMLRASGCDHVRAAEVLRAWGGMPTGTPGTHASHSSANKHSSQGGTSHQHQGSSSSLAMQEGVAMFATSSSYAIIDVSDVSGSDDTIYALCDDLVQ